MADKKNFDNEEFLNYVISSVFYPASLGEKRTSARNYKEIAKAKDKEEARNILLSMAEKNPEYFNSALEDYGEQFPEYNTTVHSFNADNSKKRPVNIDAMDISDVNFRTDLIAKAFGLDKKGLFKKLYNDPDKKETAYDDVLSRGGETLLEMLNGNSNADKYKVLEGLGLNPSVFNTNDADFNRTILNEIRPFIERSYKADDYGLAKSIVGALFAPKIMEAQRQGKGATAADAIADIVLGSTLGRLKAGQGLKGAFELSAKATGLSSLFDLGHDMVDEQGKKYVYSDGDERTASALDLLSSKELIDRGKQATLGALFGGGIGGIGSAGAKRVVPKINSLFAKGGKGASKNAENVANKLDDLEYQLVQEKGNYDDIGTEISNIKKTGAVNGEEGATKSDEVALSGLDMLSGQHRESFMKIKELERAIEKLKEQGDVVAYNKALKLINSLGLNPAITFKGRVADEDSRRHYSNAINVLRGK